MNRMGVAISMMLVLAGTAAWACEGTVPPIDYAGTWPRQVYRVTVIAPKGAAAGDAMASSVEAFLKGDGKDCNLALERVEAGSKDAEPVAVLSDPLGRPLLSFTGKIDTARLKSMTNSPAREKISKALLDHPLMLLIIEGSDAEKNAKAQETAKGAIKMATELFPREQLPTPPLVVTVKASDPAEAGFMEVLRVPTDLAEPRMTMLMGNGKVVETPSPRISEERILDRVQRLVAALEVVFPYMFESDILMPIPEALLP